MKKTYKIDVDCANCANKMEEAAKKTAGVKDATVNFMTLKMIVEFEEGQDPKAVLPVAGGTQGNKDAAADPGRHRFRSAMADLMEPAMISRTSSSMPHHMGTLKELSHQRSRTGQSNSPAPSFWNRG